MSDLPEGVAAEVQRILEEVDNWNALAPQTYYRRRPALEIAAFVWQQAYGDGYEAGFATGYRRGVLLE